MSLHSRCRDHKLNFKHIMVQSAKIAFISVTSYMKGNSVQVYWYVVKTNNWQKKTVQQLLPAWVYMCHGRCTSLWKKVSYTFNILPVKEPLWNVLNSSVRGKNTGNNMFTCTCRCSLQVDINVNCKKNVSIQ